MDTEDIPENATPERPDAEYVDGGDISEEKEPTVTSIPDDVVIPPENRTGGVETREPTDLGSTEPKIQVEETVIYKSIWPPLLFSFFLGITIGTMVLLFSPLRQFGPTQIQIEQNAPITDSKPIPDATTTQVHFNQGFGSKGGSLARSIAVDRIQQAAESVVWITNFPSDTAILQAMQQNNQAAAKLIFIGNDAQRKDSNQALSLGLAVFRAGQTLDDNESFLIIDNQYVIDIGRSNTVWETIDSHVAGKAKEWMEKLLKNSTPL